MKALSLLLLLLLSSAGLSVLVVYSYDSFVPLALETFEEFTLKTGIEVKLKTLSDSGSLVNYIVSMGEKFDGDVVIGIDNLLSRKAFKADIFLPYKPAGSENLISQDLIFDPLWRLTPYDYGAIALIYDSQSITSRIESLQDLADVKFKKSLILQDPRTSSTGLAFLSWTYLLFGEDFEQFWRSLKPSILTITLGWDDSFEKFEAGEAPIMVSYATDGAYSAHYYGQADYSVLIPQGKGYVQIEGAGIVRWTDKPGEARIFLDYLLSPDFQRHIPLNQWMFPVIEVEMPAVFQYAVKPETILKLPSGVELEELIEKWEKIIYEK